MFFVYASILVVVVLMWPSDAFAWGPGMHVELAMRALADFPDIVPHVAALIGKFPDAFIYGAAAPDIVVGKRLAGYLHHCHNWRIGRLILNEAETERQRASAYGYLLHLAADVVAHNYYIPVKIVRSFKARVLTHTYWEMRFDLGVPKEAWERLSGVSSVDVEEFDGLLERVLRKTLFSFSTNKRIFSTILMLQKMRGMRASLTIYAKKSRFDIPDHNRQVYHDLAVEAVRGFLKDPAGAECLSVDPAGYARLTYAKNLRRRIKEMLRRGMMDDEQAATLVELVRGQLAIGLYRPAMVLPDVTDVL